MIAMPESSHTAGLQHCSTIYIKKPTEQATNARLWPSGSPVRAGDTPAPPLGSLSACPLLLTPATALKTAPFRWRESLHSCEGARDAPMSCAYADSLHTRYARVHPCTLQMQLHERTSGRSLDPASGAMHSPGQACRSAKLRSL